VNKKEKVKAYVLMKLDIGESANVIEELKKIKAIVKVASTTGLFDIIVRVEVEDIKDLEKVISKQIHSIEGIKSTETQVVINEVILED